MVDDARRPGDPTPEEIAMQAAAIRRGWTDAQKRGRYSNVTGLRPYRVGEPKVGGVREVKAADLELDPFFGE